MGTQADDLGHDVRSHGDPTLLRAVAVLARELEAFRAAADEDRARLLAGLGLTVNQSQLVRELLARLNGLSLRKVSHAFEGLCPITWQPSISKPVFYGYRNFGPADGAPSEVRVFYPSLEGSPANAPMLTYCGYYPLILFLHGHCRRERDPYLSWYRLPAQLARSGYIVAVPRLAGIAGGGVPWTEPNGDLITANDLHVWIRGHPEFTVHVAPSPQTGIIGHSYGAMLGARLANDVPCSAYVSLSAGWNDWYSSGEPIPLGELSVPSLFMWGGASDQPAILEGQMQFVWDLIPMPKHKIVFADAGHWLYLSAGDTMCYQASGSCTITHSLAADFATSFFSKYMPPARWSSLESTIPDNLHAPLPSGLTTEEAFYEGGHLMGFKMLPFSEGCSVASSWDKPGSSGTRMFFSP
jgi:pimeloyl-ACP methyl ester carboxylesterase